ncbi:DUF4232 domain-containing protein [Actinopolyspora mortivallis]|uniref:DUF4232 domain-containing protein n=1 Tax=Actinopolyspora mortivallis TaxID=33906 RepID=A0A2T0GX61_ACTMO|nr:DUF4232 domain-containing protein [Actinopolyspora mortivallis]PRW63699.1 hypothetical protein CEP50_08770 [Actinopolyspora mortivallis]
MPSRRRTTPGQRVFAAATTLLTGALLAGCGQQQPDPVDPVEAAGELADASSTSADHTSSSATTSRRTDPPERTGRTSRDSTDSADTEGGHDTAPSKGESTSSANTAQQRPAGARCDGSVLRGSMEQGRPGAGQRYATLTLRNTGDTTCTLRGYPELELLDSSGEALPTEVSRNQDPPPTTVRLAPQRTTSARLHWGVVPTGSGPEDCEPVPTSVRVTPPETGKSFRLPWNYGRVCGSGHIDLTAFR